MAGKKGSAKKTDQNFVYSENEERSMDIDYVPPPEKPKQVSGMLKLFSWGLLIFTGVSELFSGEYDPDTISILVLRFLIMAVFAAFFSEMCAKMAARIKKNLDFAWVLGFLFGFIGIGVYWIYYRISLRKGNNAGEEKKGGKKVGRAKPGRSKKG